jgi:septum formation protein
MNKSSRTVVLASASPRRRELLEQIGLTPVVRSADIDETPLSTENTSDYVRRLSLGKAEKIAGQATAHKVVIGADTVIDYNGQIMGKPASLEQCIDMLSQLSAQTHRVLTGVTVIGDSLVESQVVGTDVSMREITEAEIRAYWHTGEPQGKAGSYAIQGRGARFVKGISGSYSNVVGLPLFETATMLAGYGIRFDEPGAS